MFPVGRYYEKRLAVKIYWQIFLKLERKEGRKKKKRKKKVVINYKVDRLFTTPQSRKTRDRERSTTMKWDQLLLFIMF